MTNDGIITADEIALNISSSDSSAAIQVINTGAISGIRDGIVSDSFLLLTTGTATLDNSGTIIGANGRSYFGRGGVDNVTNSGFMSGNTVLGLGDDIYDGALGSVSGAVMGGAGKDKLFGDTGADNLQGGNDNDIIRGGDSDDMLSGQAGNDKIRASAGDDIFIFGNKSGHDIIKDFDATANGEKIDLSAGTTIRNFAQLSNAASQIGADVLIDTGGNNSILLLGVDLADLENGDFIF